MLYGDGSAAGYYRQEYAQYGLGDGALGIDPLTIAASALSLFKGSTEKVDKQRNAAAYALAQAGSLDAMHYLGAKAGVFPSYTLERPLNVGDPDARVGFGIRSPWANAKGTEDARAKFAALGGTSKIPPAYVAWWKLSQAERNARPGQNPERQSSTPATVAPAPSSPPVLYKPDPTKPPTILPSPDGGPLIIPQLTPQGPAPSEPAAPLPVLRAGLPDWVIPVAVGAAALALLTRGGGPRRGDW